MDNSNYNQRKITIALICICATFIVVIITASLVIANFSNKKEARIINESTNTEEGLIPEEQMTLVKKALYSLLQRTSSAKNDFDASIRWNTVKTSEGNNPTTTFLVDVDEYQQTYRIEVDRNRARIACPQIGETKYPGSFCIGNTGEYDDSINVVLGPILPYTGYTEEGEHLSVNRNSTSEMKNVRDRHLEVVINTCPFDNAAKERANQALDNLITSMGGDPSIFERKIMNGGGCHGE